MSAPRYRGEPQEQKARVLSIVQALRKAGKPLKVTTASAQAGMGRHQFRRYINALIAEGKLAASASGRLESTEQQKAAQAAQYVKVDSLQAWIDAYPDIQDLRDKLMVAKTGGRPLKGWKFVLATIKSACDQLRVLPTAFLQDGPTTEKLVTDLSVLRQQKGLSPESLTAYSKAIVRLCGLRGIVWQRGAQGVMSRKKVFYAQHSDIARTDKELEADRQWLSQNSDQWTLTVFDYAVETCARANGLLTTRVRYLDEQEGGYLLAKVYETKTEKLWKKYLLRSFVKEEVRAQLTKAQAQHAEYLFLTDGLNLAKALAKLRREMRRLYAANGLHEKNRDREGGAEEVASYVMRKPIHTLRHIGAQYWLRLTGFNYGLVAEIGGWDDVQELKKSYGAMPESYVVAAILQARRVMDGADKPYGGSAGEVTGLTQDSRVQVPVITQGGAQA